MVRTPVAFIVAGLLAIPSAPAAHAQQATGRLSLPDAVALAQRQGAQALSARHSLDAARAAHRAYNARQLPQVFLSGDVPSYNRSIIPAPQPDGSLQFRSQQLTNSSLNLIVAQSIPLTGGQLRISSELAQLKRTGAPETWSSTPFSIALTQPIGRSNALAWTRADQELSAELAERTYAEAMEDVASATAAAYLSLYAADATLRAARENVDRNERLMEKVSARARVGAASSYDVRQIELNRLRARQALSQAELARDEADATLRAMLGVPSTMQFELDLPEALPAFDPDTAQAIDAALRYRADLTALELQDTRARRAVSVARFDGGIGAAITASYGYNATAPGLGEVYEDLLDRQAFRLNVTLPLWQWGASSADVESARSTRAAVTVNTQNTREQITRDAVFTIRRLRQARGSQAIAVEADTIASERLRDALVRYDFGSMQLENVFIAMSDKDQARQQYIQSVAAFWTEYYRLRRVTMYDFDEGRRIGG